MPELNEKEEAVTQENINKENNTNTNINDDNKRKLNRNIIAIDGKVLADSEKSIHQQTLIDLKESLNANMVMTGIVSGVETAPIKKKDSNKNDVIENGKPVLVSIPVAIVNHGDFKIIIPFSKFMDEEELLNFNKYSSQNEYNTICLTKRLGSEIDFIINKINEDKCTAIASRKKAMIKKKKQFLFKKVLNKETGEMEYLIKKDRIVEARIVSTKKSGIIVEIFGLECFIPLRELQWNMINDATSEYYPGQRIIVKILDAEIDEETGQVSFELSVKQVSENPHIKEFLKYREGSLYSGVVEKTTPHGIFVTLNKENQLQKVTVLCKFNDRINSKTLLPESRVHVRITNKDEEKHQLFGYIVSQQKIGYR